MRSVVPLPVRGGDSGTIVPGERSSALRPMGGWLGGSTGSGSGRVPTPRVWGPDLMYYRRVSPIQ